MRRVNGVWVAITPELLAREAEESIVCLDDDSDVEEDDGGTSVQRFLDQHDSETKMSDSTPGTLIATNSWNDSMFGSREEIGGGRDISFGSALATFSDGGKLDRTFGAGASRTANQAAMNALSKLLSGAVRQLTNDKIMHRQNAKNKPNSPSPFSQL